MHGSSSLLPMRQLEKRLPWMRSGSGWKMEEGQNKIIFVYWLISMKLIWKKLSWNPGFPIWCLRIVSSTAKWRFDYQFSSSASSFIKHSRWKSSTRVNGIKHGRKLEERVWDRGGNSSWRTWTRAKATRSRLLSIMWRFNLPSKLVRSSNQWTRRGLTSRTAKRIPTLWRTTAATCRPTSTWPASTLLPSFRQQICAPGRWESWSIHKTVQKTLGSFMLQQILRPQLKI